MNKKLSGLLPFSVISEKRPSDMTDIEQSRNVLQFTLFGVIGCFFLYLFAGISLLQGRSELGLYLLSFAVIGTVLTLYVRLTRHFLLASWLAAIMLMILSLYLVISGGAANTGPLWIYPVSAIILFIQGAHNGLKTLSVLLILVGVLFFIPLDFIAMPAYEITFKTRFFSTLIATLLVIWTMEFSRNRAFLILEDLRYEMEMVSRTDYLTGIFNRRAMIEKLNAEISRFNRTGETFSILIIDIDHFKQINDMYGHTTGDFVIRTLCQLMQDQLREHDIVSRWGGEEFLILLPNTVTEQGHYVGELLRKNIESRELSVGEDTKLHLTVSIGVSSAEYASDALVLVDQADERLYRAKRGGRNQVISTDVASEVQAPNDSVV